MRNSEGGEEDGFGFSPLPRRHRCSGGAAVLSLVSLLLSERPRTKGKFLEKGVFPSSDQVSFVIVRWVDVLVLLSASFR